MRSTRARLSLDRETALKLLSAVLFIGASVCFSFPDRAVISTGFGLATTSALISLATLAFYARPRLRLIQEELATNTARLEAKIAEVTDEERHHDIHERFAAKRGSGEDSSWMMALDSLGSILIIAIAACRFGGIFQNPGILDSPLFYIPFIISSMTLGALNANIFKSARDQRADLLELEVEVDGILLAAAHPAHAAESDARALVRSASAAEAGVGLAQRGAHRTPLRRHPPISAAERQAARVSQSLDELSPGSVEAGPATPPTPSAPLGASSIAAVPASAPAIGTAPVTMTGLSAEAPAGAKSSSSDGEGTDDITREGGAQAPRGHA